MLKENKRTMEIFGVTVDEKKAADYKKSFMICGLRCSLEYVEFGEAVYQGREVPQGFAKDKSFCEACHKIYTKEREKLVNYNAKKGLDPQGQPIKRNERKTMAMKHENFSEYLKDLWQIYSRSASERAQLKDKFEMARKKWVQCEAENRRDEYAVIKAKMDWLDAQKEYKEKCEELEKRVGDEIKAVEDEFKTHIDDFYSANGSRLDDATIRLLNSGLKLTDNEIDRLVGQNMSNPTMLRLLADYCEKNGIDNKAARIYGVVARRNGADEMTAFSGVADMLMKSVSMDERTADTWSPARGHFERLCSEQIVAIDNSIVKPAPADQE